MIQEEQEDCLNNLMPIFTDKDILDTLFASIVDVDRKFKDLQMIRQKNANQGSKDLLD